MPLGPRAFSSRIVSPCTSKTAAKQQQNISKTSAKHISVNSGEILLRARCLPARSCRGISNNRDSSRPATLMLILPG